MEIETFLELCAGKWFSQRTNYYLDRQKAENGKSEITIERLLPDRPSVVQLCQQHRINPETTLGGTQANWDNSTDFGQTKRSGSTTLILVPDRDRSRTGQILQAGGSLSKSAMTGRYILGNDEALTLRVELGDGFLEERIWFASPNLRLRTSLIQQTNGCNATVFYSEIRRLPPKESESA